MGTAIIKVGGEPVAVIDDEPERIENIKNMLKAIYPGERITVKIIPSSEDTA